MGGEGAFGEEDLSVSEGLCKEAALGNGGRKVEQV